MANKTILMSSIRQILRLYAQGSGKKRISALIGTSRNTVKKYLHKLILLKLTYADIDAIDDHQLDLLLTEPPSLPKDGHYEQLQKLLPELEKQLKRKVPGYNFGKCTEWKIHKAMADPGSINIFSSI